MRAMKTSNFSNLHIDKEGKFLPEDVPQFVQYMRNSDSDLSRIFVMVSGQLRFGTTANLKFGENLFGQWVIKSDTGTANVEFSVTHSLSSETIGIIPANYLVTSISKAGVVYKDPAGTAWTTTTAYFKCSTANTAVNIFLMP